MAVTEVTPGDLSVTAHSVARMSNSWSLVNPWRGLRDREHVTLSTHVGGPMGKTNHDDQEISYRVGLTWEERRCTIEHECRHIDDGPQPVGLRAKNEERIRRDTAEAMIPDIRPVADAIAWALSEEEAAMELGVDVYVLRYRLKHMSPMEKAWLKHRLEQADAVGEC